MFFIGFTVRGRWRPWIVGGLLGHLKYYCRGWDSKAQGGNKDEGGPPSLIVVGCFAIIQSPFWALSGHDNGNQKNNPTRRNVWQWSYIRKFTDISDAFLVYIPNMPIFSVPMDGFQLEWRWLSCGNKIVCFPACAWVNNNKMYLGAPAGAKSNTEAIRNPTCLCQPLSKHQERPNFGFGKIIIIKATILCIYISLLHHTSSGALSSSLREYQEEGSYGHGTSCLATKPRHLTNPVSMHW